MPVTTCEGKMLMKNNLLSVLLGGAALLGVTAGPPFAQQQGSGLEFQTAQVV